MRMLLTHLEIDEATRVIDSVAAAQKPETDDLLWKTFETLAEAKAPEELVGAVLRRIDTTVHGHEALEWCCMRGDVGLVEQLLTDAAVDPGANNGRALATACRNGHNAIVARLLRDSRVDPTGSHAIRDAIYGNQEETLRLLLADDRSIPNTDDLYVACHSGNLPIVEMLLADGRAQPDYDTFQAALGADKRAVFERLMQTAAWESIPKEQLLFAAAGWGGDADTVKFLVECVGVDATAGDNKAIRVAVAKGEDETVAYLLARPGVDPTACNNEALRDYARRGYYSDSYLRVGDLLVKDGRVSVDRHMVVAVLTRRSLDSGERSLDVAEQLIKILKRQRDEAREEDETRKKRRIDDGEK